MQLIYGPKVLVERSQLSPNKDVRQWNSVITKRVKRADTNVVQAAMRGIENELNVSLGLTCDGFAHLDKHDHEWTEMLHLSLLFKQRM